MLLVRHALADEELAARFFQYELRSEELLVVRTRCEGAVMDEGLEPVAPGRRSGWNTVRLVVAGTVLARTPDGDVVLDPGDAYVSTEWSGAPLRALTTTADTVRLFWRARGPVGFELPRGGRLGVTRSTRAAAVRLAGALASSDARGARRASFDAIDALRAAGVPFAPEAREEMLSEVPAASHAFARAIERVLMPMAQQPMAVDLARWLGVGEAQALRRAADHFRRYHVSIGSWREYVHGMRIALATLFIAARGARTEHVSRLLGFGSPTGLCHAFHDEGLPSPMALQKMLLAS